MSIVQQLLKMISLFDKKYPDKLIITLLLINTTSLIVRLIVKLSKPNT